MSLLSGRVYAFVNLRAGSPWLGYNDATNQVQLTQAIQDQSLKTMWTAISDSSGFYTFNSTDSSGNPVYMGYEGTPQSGTSIISVDTADKAGKFNIMTATGGNQTYVALEAQDSGLVLQANPDSGIVLSPPVNPANSDNPDIFSQVWSFPLFRIECHGQTIVCTYCTYDSSMIGTSSLSSGGQFCNQLA